MEKAARECLSFWPLAFRRKAQTEGARDVTASCCRCIEDSESVDDAQTDAQDDVLLTLLQYLCKVKPIRQR